MLTRCSAGAPGSGSAPPPAAGPCCSRGDKTTLVCVTHRASEPPHSSTKHESCVWLPGAEGDWKHRKHKCRTHKKDRRSRAARVPRGREDAACGGGAGPELHLPCQVSSKNQPTMLSPSTCKFAAKSISTRRQARVSTMRASTRNGVHKSLSTYSISTAPDWLRWIPSRHWRVLFSMVGCRVREERDKGSGFAQWKE